MGLYCGLRNELRNFRVVPIRTEVGIDLACCLMNKSILVLLAALSIGKAQAQTSVYHEFPDSNANWNIVAQGCCWTGCPGPPTPNPVLGDYNFSYYIGGDTIINSVTYHKLYKSGSMHEYCYAGNYINNWVYYDDYAGAFREDTALRHVYLMQQWFSTECLMYDFSAGVGDTINFCDGCAVVTSIDSVLVGGNYRKQFNLSTAPYVVIEGIGSTAGLLEPFCPFEYSGTLTCFLQDEQPLYPDTISSCNLITAVNNLQTHAQILTIAPNPFSTQTMVYAQVPMHDASLSVVNCVGETVFQVKNLNGLMFSFDRSSLPQGLYFFQMVQNDNVVATSKVVIAD